MPLPAFTIVRDSGLVAMTGIVVALIANALSPHGLSLTRDYFLTGSVSVVPPAHQERGAPSAKPHLKEAPSQQPAATTKRGLLLANYDEAARCFHDPGFAAGRIIFVDARSAAIYAAGHIPGAYGFDHYRPDDRVASVLAAAQAAERIVIYCHGGDCEDSELAALDLMALGVPPAKLVVYGGGFSEWRQRGMPVQRSAQ